MRFAVALTITKNETGKLAMTSVVGVYTARSKEEALGYCIQRIRKERPDYSVSSTAVMRIKPESHHNKEASLLLTDIYYKMKDNFGEAWTYICEHKSEILAIADKVQKRKKG